MWCFDRIKPNFNLQYKCTVGNYSVVFITFSFCLLFLFLVCPIWECNFLVFTMASWHLNLPTAVHFDSISHQFPVFKFCYCFSKSFVTLKQYSTALLSDHYNCKINIFVTRSCFKIAVQSLRSHVLYVSRRLDVRDLFPNYHNLALFMLQLMESHGDVGMLTFIPFYSYKVLKTLSPLVNITVK